MQSFDVIVVGTGSAGSTVATTVREAGKKVAIIDKVSFGGTCSQRGCDPKKILVGAAEIVARSGQLVGKGIRSKAAISWPDLIAFKKTFTDPIPGSTEEKYAKAGIAAFHGAATFTSTNSIRVGDDELKADTIVLATGHRPKPLGIPGEDLVTDSTGFMDLESLPRKIVMIGGGYIAFEFANIAARAGANVTIISDGPRPLANFEADMVKLLVQAMEAIGITILNDAKVTGVKAVKGGLRVQYKQGGKTRTVTGGLVVHGAGREADVAELDLETGGVQLGKKGIVVNEHLQSVSNPKVYACGDAAEKGLPLTPLAGYEGRIVAENILHGNKRNYTDQPTASAVFTIPTMASVGLTEEQAVEQKKDVAVMTGETSSWYMSRRINEPFSGYKILVDKKTDYIVGAHLLGANSEEMINLFLLAMRYSIPASELKKMLFAYPSHGSELRSML